MPDDIETTSGDEELDDELDTEGADEGDEAGDEDQDDAEGTDDEDKGSGERDADEGDNDRRPRGAPDRGQAEARRTREARLRRENDDLRRQVQQRGDPDAQRRAYQEFQQRRQREIEDARLDGPEKVSEVRDRHLREDFAAETGRLRNDHFDRADKAEFRALLSEKPHLRRVASRTEEIVSVARSNGNFSLTRETAALLALGELTDKAAREQRGSRQQRADATRRRETVRPPRGGSDAPPNRRRKSEAEMSAEEWEAAFGDQPIR